ncbi:MAG TPA: hypothetical protein VFH92_10415 [Phenylobacterium sp.]|nr:hypothetical protein [Phenylobacterium sp.]
MTKLPITLGAAAALLAASGGAAAAHCRPHYGAYVTRYHAETRYVRRTVYVPHRVWRPVHERVVYVRERPIYRTYRTAWVDEAPVVRVYDGDYGWRRDEVAWRPGGWHRGWYKHPCRHRHWDDED